MPAVITEIDVPLSGELKIAIGTIVTPSARDLARIRGVSLTEVPKEQAITAAAPARTVAIGADHGGFGLKAALKPIFEELKLQVIDVGVFEEKAADYPDIAEKAAQIITSGQATRGVLIDGAGIGSSMAANKI